MKAELDFATEEDADGPEMENDVNSNDVYDKHLLMLSMINIALIYKGISK